MKKISNVISASLSGLAMALPAFAQQPNPAGNLFVSFDRNDFGSVAAAIITSLLGITGVIAMLYVIWGGYQYMTAGANEDLAKRGRSTLRNAIIGLIIVILSYIIVTVVVNSLSGTTLG
jgi:hypothetical protein